MNTATPTSIAPPVPDIGSHGTNGTIIVVADRPYTFRIADFGFTGPNDARMASKSEIKIPYQDLGSFVLGKELLSPEDSFPAEVVASGSFGLFQFIPNPGAAGSFPFPLHVYSNDGTLSEERILTVTVLHAATQGQRTKGRETMQDEVMPYKDNGVSPEIEAQGGSRSSTGFGSPSRLPVGSGSKLPPAQPFQPPLMRPKRPVSASDGGRHQKKNSREQNTQRPLPTAGHLIGAAMDRAKLTPPTPSPYISIAKVFDKTASVGPFPILRPVSESPLLYDTSLYETWNSRILPAGSFPSVRLEPILRVRPRLNSAIDATTIASAFKADAYVNNVRISVLSIMGLTERALFHWPAHLHLFHASGGEYGSESVRSRYELVPPDEENMSAKGRHLFRGETLVHIAKRGAGSVVITSAPALDANSPVSGSALAGFSTPHVNVFPRSSPLLLTAIADATDWVARHVSVAMERHCAISADARMDGAGRFDIVPVKCVFDPMEDGGEDPWFEGLITFADKRDTPYKTSNSRQVNRVMRNAHRSSWFMTIPYLDGGIMPIGDAPEPASDEAILVTLEQDTIMLANVNSIGIDIPDVACLPDSSGDGYGEENLFLSVWDLPGRDKVAPVACVLTFVPFGLAEGESLLDVLLPDLALPRAGCVLMPPDAYPVTGSLVLPLPTTPPPGDSSVLAGAATVLGITSARRAPPPRKR